MFFRLYVSSLLFFRYVVFVVSGMRTGLYVVGLGGFYGGAVRRVAIVESSGCDSKVVSRVYFRPNGKVRVRIIYQLIGRRSVQAYGGWFPREGANLLAS